MYSFSIRSINIFSNSSGPFFGFFVGSVESRNFDDADRGAFRHNRFTYGPGNRLGVMKTAQKIFQKVAIL